MATTNAAMAEAIAPVVSSIEVKKGLREDPVDAMARFVEKAAREGRIAQSWYVINKVAEDEAEVRIYQDIGMFGVTASQFTDSLEQVQAKTLHVRLNSYGGDLFDGFAINNALRAHPAKVVVHVDGIAASATSIIAMAGDEVRMADNAFMMIHEAESKSGADEPPEVSDKLNDAIASTYQRRAGKTRKYWRDKMAKETWFAASEARDEGLADVIDTPSKGATNRFDFRVYNQIKHVPDAVVAAWGINNEPKPEASPRGEEVPVSPIQEVSAMSTTPETAAPASPAVTAPPEVKAAARETVAKKELAPLNQMAIEGYLAQGHKTGLTEGVKLERERSAAIAAACPGKSDLAIAAILAGQTPEGAKIMFDSTCAAEARAKADAEAKDAEIARWQALAATGGYPIGVPMSPTEDAADETPRQMSREEAKAQAETEWTRTPKVRNGFSTKERYVNYRTAQLMGQISRQVAGAAS